MIVSIPQPEIPAWVHSAARRFGLQIKSEFHVTVSSLEVDRKHPTIQEVAQDYEFQVVPLNAYWMARQSYEASEFVRIPHTRTAIVQVVQVNGLDAFCDRLGIRAPYFPHVTLFVGSDHPEEKTSLDGIAIHSLVDKGLWIDQMYPSFHF